MKIQIQMNWQIKVAKTLGTKVKFDGHSSNQLRYFKLNRKQGTKIAVDRRQIFERSQFPSNLRHKGFKNHKWDSKRKLKL